MDVKETKDFLKEHGINTVMAGGIDQTGTMRGKRLTTTYFLESVMERGLRFAVFLLKSDTVDTPAEGIMQNGVPDILGLPDLSTLRVAPWESDTALVFLDWHWTDGTPCDLCPRTLLKKKVQEANERGFDPVFALELEFCLLNSPLSDIRSGGWSEVDFVAKDKHCYSLYEGSFYEPVARELRSFFPDAIEGCSPEWGEGQLEINLRKSAALPMADTSVLFKMATKELASRNGITASFMAKVHEGHSGNSGHIHHSLVDIENGVSACYDESRPHCMAKQFEAYVAGLLELIADSTLFFAPFVNSYKRFEPYSFAGTHKSWGVDNRTVAFRFINDDATSARIENRVGGADLNPYIAFSAMIGAGLWGLENELTLGPPLTGDCYALTDLEPLPQTLGDAVSALGSSARLKEIMGAAFVDNLLKVARVDINAFNTTVTDLERRRYLEMA